MNSILLFLMTYAAFVFDSSVAPLTEWGPFAPRLVPAALVWGVWRSRGRAGMIAAAFAGLVADGLSRGPLGIELAVFVLAAWTIQMIRARGETLSTIAAATLTGAVVSFLTFASAVAQGLVERQAI